MRYFKFVPLLIAGALGCLTVPGFAQLMPADGIVTGERLSDWLLRKVPLNGDTTSVHWLVPSEVRAQENLRQSLLLDLPDRGVLTARIGNMRATGRLNLARTDPRWLQAAPDQDPTLKADQQVLRFARPKLVALISDSGEICATPHQAGALAQDYLRACWTAAHVSSVDFAWLAQPDGHTQRVGVASWSQTDQDQPAPGAWIWAPGRHSGIHYRVSDNLIRFLATQPPFEYLSVAPNDTVSGPVQEVVPTQSRVFAAAVTASDWGEVGLLQTPTARMAPAGELRFAWTKVDPYTRGTFMFQPLDWLEAGFRYSDISNRLYNPDIAGDQSLKDKSIDFKIRLLQEEAYRPQLALGVRDLGGTGLFSGEYLVANKRWGNLDASLGLGWGYLGSRADFSGVGSRQGNTESTGGTANLKDMFKGPGAFFGGVQWQSPAKQWLLKAEWDGNSYQKEPYDNYQTVASRINLGAVYRFSPNWDFNAALERGNKLMLGLTFHVPLDKQNTPKVLDPVVPPVQAVPVISPRGWEGTAQVLELFTGWGVQSIARERDVLKLVAETDGAPYVQERIDKAISLLHRDSPEDLKRFELRLLDRGLLVSNLEVNRAEWIEQRLAPVPPALRLPTQQLSSGAGSQAIKTPIEIAADDNYVRNGNSVSSLEWAPSYQQILGGPDSFILYQMGFKAKAEHRFTDSTWLSADFNARLLDNYQNFKYDAPSDLPRVRTLQREFTTTSRTTMPLAQLTSVAELGRGNYASVYGGMLESMYGGVGAEWLYRPWQGKFAFGVDVNHVQQRGFKQDFGFRDYSVNTGHASLYWDTGWNDIQVDLSVGQYLAGDVGATLDIKRYFRNGLAIGAWATKTNVSAEQFGEGSFDKGIYISIPFDILSPKSTPGIANLVWNPLTRDGGAKLDRRFKLYDMTRYRDARTWKWRPDVSDSLLTGKDTSYVLSEPPPTVLEAPFEAGATLFNQIRAIPGSTWLWTGGAILASSLLDTELDQWMKNHQSGNVSRLGTITNNVPYVLAAGAGLLAMGVADEATASTAATSITAAGYTLGANYLTRFAIGRSRPFDELGNNNFNGFRSEAVRSGFASNHVAVAFALATPFAQQYNMPWLYAAAASTGLGRLNDREHWMSDTVAGGLMGYAIGSLLYDQQKGLRRGVRITATSQSIEATWSY